MIALNNFIKSESTKIVYKSNEFLIKEDKFKVLSSFLFFDLYKITDFSIDLTGNRTSWDDAWNLGRSTTVTSKTLVEKKSSRGNVWHAKNRPSG